MKITIKRITSLLLIIIISTFFASYIYSHLSEFKQIALADPEKITLLILITLIAAILNGLIIKYLAEPFSIKLDFKEWFGLATITTFYNTIMPMRSGLFTKAAYLKKKHAFSFTNFIAMMAGIYVINLFVSGIIGFLSLVIIYVKYKIFNLPIALLFLGILLVTSMIVIFSPKLPETNREFLNKFIRVINGWHLIKNNTKVITISATVALLQIIINAFATLLSFRMIFFEIDFVRAVFITSIGTLSVLIGITPASLGITEGLAILTGWVLGITTAKSLAAALIRRLASTAIIFILGPIFSYILLKHKPGK